LNWFKQIQYFIGAALLVGLLFNFSNPKGIPLIADKMDTVSSIDEVNTIFIEPQIREVDLKSAMEFHKSGILFVDARAEEYLANGVIPGAISNDDVDALVETIDYLIGYEKGFVIYCSDDDCGSSEDLAYDLQSYGFSNIFVFKGGWKSWTDAGLEIQKP